MRAPARRFLRLGAIALATAAVVACGGSVAPERSAGGHSQRETVESGEGTANATDPRCLPQGGYVDDACDSCENAACCEERFDCYDDATCGAAADALDGCTAAAAGEAAVLTRCWATFRKANGLAESRVACQRTHCARECGVPD